MVRPFPCTLTINHDEVNIMVTTTYTLGCMMPPMTRTILVTNTLPDQSFGAFRVSTINDTRIY